MPRWIAIRQRVAPTWPKPAAMTINRSEEFVKKLVARHGKTGKGSHAEVESLLARDASDPRMVLNRPAVAPGTRIGPYEIESQLGAGGMGEVWRARDIRLGRTVALKLSKTEFSQRFERETRAVAALNHPHIATLYDVDPKYFVMEYVEGKPLQLLIPRKGMNLSLASWCK